MTLAPPPQDIHVCSAINGESKRITESVLFKVTVFHFRDEINAAFAKPPRTALRVFLGQQLLRVGPFKLVDLLSDYLCFAKRVLGVGWLSST